MLQVIVERAERSDVPNIDKKKSVMNIALMIFYLIGNL